MTSPNQEVQEIYGSQKEYFKSGITKSVSHRIKALRKLLQVVETHEDEIYDALKTDLGKSKFEAYVSEYQVVITELKKAIKKTPKWSQPRKVRPSLLNFPSKARQYPEPYGNTLIISPWNYPFQLGMAPLIGSIAAGNTVVLKPSEFSSATSTLLQQIINEAFDPAHATVILGDADIAQELTSKKWDYLFFTGSPAVGKKIYQAAAQHLTPVTLELGGKNPCVVHESANLEVTARRIIWAKFLNCGQTCIAPDYLLVHHSIKDQLVKLLKENIKDFYTERPQQSNDYGRIIRRDHFDQLMEMIDGEQLLHGGTYDASNLFLEPTLINEPNSDSKVMEGEIFGPILPIISYQNTTNIEGWIDRYPKPLGAYVFSSDSSFEQWFIQRFSYGGGVINDSIVQFLNERLPFGGVGNSGIGNYHGKHTFDTFSHLKSVVHRGTWLDIKVKYPPYDGKFNLAKRFLNWF